MSTYDEQKTPKNNMFAGVLSVLLGIMGVIGGFEVGSTGGAVIIIVSLFVGGCGIAMLYDN